MLKAAFARMASVFTPTEILTGQEYQNRGYVLSVRLSDGLLKARVKNGQGQIYDIHMDLKAWPSHPARCTCGQKNHCEHAAASLIALNSKESRSFIESRSLSLPEFSQQEESATFHVDDLAWYSELKPVGHDFFTYQLGIIVDGEQVNIVPMIVELMQRWDLRAFEDLPDHKLIQLPIKAHQTLKIELARLKPLLRILVQYTQLSPNGADLKLRQYQLLLMQEVELAIAATKARWLATADLTKRLRTLTLLEGLPPITTPQGLQAILRDYQHQGLSWLNFLREQQFSGILADDMGLGKTLQTLTLLLYEKEQGRLRKACLILAPTSLIVNWYEEARRFAPALKVAIFHGTERQANFDNYDLVISTYGLVQRDKTLFLNYFFYYIILDEAQSIKNFRAKTTQIVYQLQAEHRLCLTGTPLENHLGELWSLFHFLMPGLLGTAQEFRKRFRIPIERYQDVTQKEFLVRRIQPFMLRRTKQEVIHELPAKTEITHLIELQGSQRDLYEAIRLTMEEKVRAVITQYGLGKSQIVILDALLKLRQICCDPRLLTLPEATVAHGCSGKLDALMTLLDNLLEEGRYVLVFSQFTSMLKLIEERLKARHYPYYKLTGQTHNRHKLVEGFQAGEVPIFLISLKAGGLGLNLTRADTVILYDPWWNPTVQDQAIDRSHRMGQENPVFVYKLIAAGTVEEVILEMQVTKKRLFQSILSDQQTGGVGLTEADIEKFFSEGFSTNLNYN